jgi:putative membrane protein
MLMTITAHASLPAQPHDLWSAWNVEPVVLVGLAAVAVSFARGRRRGLGAIGSRQRAWCVAAALAVIALALVSPLDAVSKSLASAHMVQHVVLILVAAPLLALGAPGAAIVRGAPAIARRTLARWRRPFGSARKAFLVLATPIAAWLLHMGALWFWHAAVPYDAALENESLHALEHACFLITALLFWRAVLPPLGTHRAATVISILLVFAMAMQSVFLSALLTFSTSAWYAVYADSTAAWGLTPLEDQHLAGAIMWVPAGFIYVAAGLAVVVAWIRAAEHTGNVRIRTRGS